MTGSGDNLIAVTEHLSAVRLQNVACEACIRSPPVLTRTPRSLFALRPFYLRASPLASMLMQAPARPAPRGGTSCRSTH